jgi:protein SCO1/2
VSHEPQNLATRHIAGAGIILALATAAVLGICYLLWSDWAFTAPVPAQLPPQPRLQATPARDLDAYRHTQAAAPAAPPPRDLGARAGFDQHVGAALDMNTRIATQDGNTTTLARLADGKPLLLAFGYYRCPNLCDLTLHGIAAAVSRMTIDPARDYHVVFLSIDPREGAAAARAARDMLAGMSDNAGISTWTFATATPQAIATLTGTTGFRYFLDPVNGQYAHPAGVVVVTPTGRIAQYFFGVGYEPSALRLALVDASGGRLGNVIDQLVLLCCGYDPSTGRYSLLISRLMIVLGCLFVAAMLAGGLWLRRRTP